MPEAERRELLIVARRRTFERNEVVFHRDDPADSLHVVVKGRFAVRVTTPVGDVAALAVVARGGAFGELALVAGESRRSATVAALEPAETRAIYRDDFERVRAKHPQVNELLVAALASQVRILSERVVEAHYVDAETRVLRRLEEMADVFGREVPLTQEDLAGLAGTSRATVNRVLREQERRGALELRRGRVLLRRD